ncbi:MAG TPA: 23S rRNA (adenine(2503)-C(2))-methyltransferase RlmN [Dehalococcoidia bacterium]|nr:23S rRNA (adenine(2503)-C(2))-methyltransferase RlmN [Dehalococcoidia bacterium]
MSDLIALSTAGDDSLHALLAEVGAAPYRAAQLRAATWQPFIASLDDVRQLPHSLREQLAQRLVFSTVRVAAQTVADDGATLKLLCDVGGGLTVETVAMETPATAVSVRRGTVCVSSQVGCAVGCPFCATGRMGLRRNCTAPEIVDQVRAAAQAMHRSGFRPVTHVVYMGMGEPLANVSSTIESLHVLTGAAGISARRITVSTSGVVPAIDRMIHEAPPVTLAVSLHAATDSLRDRLVPLNKAHPLAELLAAMRRYVTHTGRRATLEWCLISGVNDSLEQARALRGIAMSHRAHVNVIPMNRIAGSPWGPPPPDVARRFLGELRDVTVTVRDTRGQDADAACGQLRAALDERRMLRPDGTLGPQQRSAVSA